MEQTLRRTGATIGISLYVIWLLAVVVLIITQLLSGPVPAVVEWVVIAGATVGFVIGTIRIVYRTPQYVEKVRGWLS